MLTQAEREQIREIVEQIREIETLKNEIRLDLMDASED